MSEDITQLQLSFFWFNKGFIPFHCDRDESNMVPDSFGDDTSGCGSHLCLRTTSERKVV